MLFPALAILGGTLATAWGFHLDSTRVMLAGFIVFLVGLIAAYAFTREDEPDLDEDFGTDWQWPRKKVGM